MRVKDVRERAMRVKDVRSAHACFMVYRSRYSIGRTRPKHRDLVSFPGVRHRLFAN
jgi:hypothetical protein